MTPLIVLGGGALLACMLLAHVVIVRRRLEDSRRLRQLAEFALLRYEMDRFPEEDHFR